MRCIVNMSAGDRNKWGDCTHRFVALKENDTAALVACRQVVARRVKLDCRYDIGWSKEGRVSGATDVGRTMSSGSMVVGLN